METVQQKGGHGQHLSDSEGAVNKKEWISSVHQPQRQETNVLEAQNDKEVQIVIESEAPTNSQLG